MHHVKVVVIHDKTESILKATRRGCNQVLRRLLDMKLGIEREEECESRVLQEIALKRRTGLLQRMLDADADVNAQGGKYGNALQAASIIQDNTEIVGMLLSAGVDVNAQGGMYENALHAAAYNSSKENIKLQLT